MPKQQPPEQGIERGGKRKAVIRKLMAKDQVICAAEMMDWQQVVLNGGPPCFHISPDDDLFCGRAKRWDGHGVTHKFVSFADLLRRF